METIDRALNNTINMHAGPTEEKIKSTLASLNRLFSELERPEYREFIRFAVQWEKLGRELKALQATIHERLAQRPVNPIDEFLKKLQKKD